MDSIIHGVHLATKAGV